MAERLDCEIVLDNAVAEAVEAVGYAATTELLQQWIAFIEEAQGYEQKEG